MPRRASLISSIVARDLWLFLLLLHMYIAPYSVYKFTIIIILFLSIPCSIVCRGLWWSQIKGSNVHRMLVYVFLLYVRMYVVEMQRYTFWVYRYITSFVSRYSDILYDFLQMDRAFFQNHHVLYLPNSYRTVKLAYNHSISHKTVHIICSVEVKTWIYQARYSIYPDIWYIDTT